MEYNLNNRSKLYSMAEEVPQDKQVKDIITLMYSVLNNAKGIGLAAPQIGISLRIIIIKTPALEQVIINPIITRRRLGKTVSKEGCLSFPGLIKKIKRDKQIIVEGFTPDWKPFKMKLRGLESYCIQHEIDHLNGITLKSKR